eukprot:SAG31_NODE_812_length_11915_cov_64.697360_8_plen_169_part_00
MKFRSSFHGCNGCRSALQAKFPFSFPQHSAPRWVEDRPGRPGSYTSWNLGQTAEWWRSSFIAPKPRRRKFKADASQEQEQETLDVLAFDTAVSFGLGQDGLRFEKKLLDIAAATIRFNNDVVARANEFAAGPQLKGSPYLAVHIRRGVSPDRLTHLVVQWQYDCSNGS